MYIQGVPAKIGPPLKKPAKYAPLKSLITKGDLEN